ncbi:MAG: hypothetical protein K2M95_02720 [Clostridiales bacterium]|nr:hypothetical protein [Clostridiales bacterium]
MSDKLFKTISVIALCVIGAALFVLAVMQIVRYCHANKKSAKLECKIIPDSKRLIWRIVNTGVRDIVIVEIGIRCADLVASYRPLFAATEDINNIPHLIQSGDIASYRKEADRFMFRQSEADQLKVSNPYVYFYVKDAEGKTYVERSDYKFVQYLTMQLGGGR